MSDNNNVFSSPISTNEPLSIFSKFEHYVRLPENTFNNNKPVETNKFYANMLLGKQDGPVWTHPYSLWFDKTLTVKSRGLAVTQIKEERKVFDQQNKPPRFFFSPGGIKSFVFGSTEFDWDTELSIESRNLRCFSALFQLKKSADEYIEVPLVRGMGFVTAIYYNLIPQFHSGVGFRSIFGAESNRKGLFKYDVTLNDDSRWTLYVTLPEGESLTLALDVNGTVIGNKSVHSAIFQLVADSSKDIDQAAGCYPIDASITGSTNNDQGTYTLNFATKGNSDSGNTLMYALPHHYQNFTDEIQGKKINSTLATTVYGNAQGYVTNKFECRVEVPNTLAFDPITTIGGKSGPKYSDDILSKIRAAAETEVQGDVEHESDIDSMYFSGKILAKYAWILYSCQYVLKDKEKVDVLLPKLKRAVGRFLDNQQKLPLHYDTVWGGIVSSGTIYQDFGNPYYNDHHFHYGYHVLTAAIIAQVDKDSGNGQWINTAKPWVEDLIRDYANPSSSDPYFPVFRSFDWYTGHSWAKGLYESGDGKDQESSSEDVNASYALKLWGIVSGNNNLSQIGDLMIGVLNTSVNNYFLYTDDNKIEPSVFIPNKVSGIFFDNKVDHTTYFGALTQYIHMIHAIPITSASSFVRRPKFVQEEWEQKLANIVNDVDDGWKGILLLNLALYDPKKSYEFFSSSDFKNQWLDNGQSLTWSLTYSGAFNY